MPPRRARRWSYRIDAPLVPGQPGGPPQTGPWQSSAAVVGDTVFASGGGRLHSLDTATGQLRWAADVRTAPMASPAVSGGTVFATELGGGRVCAVDVTTGEVRWRAEVGRVMFRWGTVAVCGETVLACGEVFIPGGALGFHIEGGVLIALDAATGAVRWHYLTESSIESSPAVADGVVYVATHGNSRHSPRLSALDVTSGALRWWLWLPASSGGVVSSPAIAGGYVYLGLPTGELLATPADGGPEPSGLRGQLGARRRASERARLAGLLRSVPVIGPP